MKFKNELEENVFNIAADVFNNGAKIEHNKTIRIENALLPEVASFHGPPKKEIDVLTIELNKNIILLISCKLFSKPASTNHVQEWCSVVQTMNKYSDVSQYLGLILSPTGFTSGCEAWASSHNIGLITPIKGKKIIFNEDTFYKMIKRAFLGIRNRVRICHTDLLYPPKFFDFVYSLTSDFEGHQESGDRRYIIMPSKWISSFSEMYSYVQGKKIKDIYVSGRSSIISFTNNTELKVNINDIEIWNKNCINIQHTNPLFCKKNIEMDECSLEEIRNIVVGLDITSAGDFGSYLELGVHCQFNLGIHPGGFHIFSTQMPFIEHKI